MHQQWHLQHVNSRVGLLLVSISLLWRAMPIRESMSISYLSARCLSNQLRHILSSMCLLRRMDGYPVRCVSCLFEQSLPVRHVSTIQLNGLHLQLHSWLLRSTMSNPDRSDTVSEFSMPKWWQLPSDQQWLHMLVSSLVCRHQL